MLYDLRDLLQGGGLAQRLAFPHRRGLVEPTLEGDHLLNMKFLKTAKVDGQLEPMDGLCRGVDAGLTEPAGVLSGV